MHPNFVVMDGTCAQIKSMNQNPGSVKHDGTWA